MRPFSPPTVVVVDLDWSYQCWLTRILSDAGFRVLPMGCVAEAYSLIRMSLATVDLMIVDPRLSGVAELVEAVRLRQGCLRVVAAVEHGAPAVCRGVEAVLEKPRDAAERDSFAGNWLAAIHVILREDQA